MATYTDPVLDHFLNPRNLGVLEDADGVGAAENPACGDTTTMYIKVRGGVIVEVRFQALGCTAAIAAGSVATEMVLGSPVEAARQLTREAIALALGGLPSHKLHCSVLAADALKKAIADYERRCPG